MLVKLDDLPCSLTSKKSACYLADLAANVPAGQAIVEIGVYLAHTTVHLAAGAAGGFGAHVYGIDPWDLPGKRYPYHWLNRPDIPDRDMFTRPGTRLEAEQLVANSDFANQITLIRGFSVSVAATWRIDYRHKIGLLLIDGDHRQPMVEADFEAWLPHLDSAATVVFDDYDGTFPGVTNTVVELVSEGRLVIDAIYDNRLAVTRVVHSTAF